LDYHDGDISPEQRERIQDHLALCRACLRTVLDLDAFPDLPPQGSEERLSSGELAIEWGRFQEQAGAARSAVRRRSLLTSAALPWGLAAALLAVIVGLSVQTVRLQRQAGELSQPQGGVELVDLSPVDGKLERAEAETEGIRLSAWADRLILILNLADIRSFPEYEVELVTADGREVWRGGGLRRSPEGTFALEVPRRFLSAGSYRIRLSGASPEGRTAVAEYSLILLQP
jgi:hypothetical protein